MFAVIKTGGKQYKVAEESIITVEKLDAEEGDSVSFEDVLMIGGDKPQIGTPLLSGTAVFGEVLEQKRGEKVINFVKRRRKHSSQRRKGHRQYLTVVKITGIGGEAPKKSAKKKAPANKEEAPKVAAKAEAAPATEGKAPANLLKSPKGDADDLSKISGVGPVLVKKLNDLGVYHFWQIAEWNASDVSYVDDFLSFKGRIERDEWIKQATEFAKG